MILDRTKAPRIQEVGQANYLKVEKHSLFNTRFIHRLPSQQSDLISMVLCFDGSFDTQHNNQLIHVLCGLMFSGTKQHPRQKLAQALDYYGAYFQCSAKEKHIEIEVFFLQRFLSDIVPIFATVLQDLDLHEQEVDLAIQRGIKNLNVSKQKVDFVAKQTFNKHIFGEKHPLGRQSRQQDLETISSTQLMKVYDQLIKNQSFDLYLTGGFSSKDEAFIIEQLSQQVDESKPKAQSLVFDTDLEPKQTRIHIPMPENMQTAIRVGFSCPGAADPNALNHKILNYVLGGYFGSRLMKNIREDKGYTYGIGSSLLFNTGPAVFSIQTEVGSAYAEDCLKQIEIEIKTLCEEPISNTELEAVKNKMLGRILESSDGLFRQATVYKSLYVKGFELQRQFDFIDSIKAMTPDRLQKTAQRFFRPSELLWVTAGV